MNLGGVRVRSDAGVDLLACASQEQYLFHDKIVREARGDFSAWCHHRLVGGEAESARVKIFWVRIDRSTQTGQRTQTASGGGVGGRGGRWGSEFGPKNLSLDFIHIFCWDLIKWMADYAQRWGWGGGETGGSPRILIKSKLIPEALVTVTLPWLGKTQEQNNICAAFISVSTLAHLSSLLLTSPHWLYSSCSYFAIKFLMQRLACKSLFPPLLSHMGNLPCRALKQASSVPKPHRQ